MFRSPNGIEYGTAGTPIDAFTRFIFGRSTFSLVSSVLSALPAFAVPPSRPNPGAEQLVLWSGLHYEYALRRPGIKSAAIQSNPVMHFKLATW